MPVRFEGNHAPFGANRANDFMRLAEGVDNQLRMKRLHRNLSGKPHESWLRSYNGEARGLIFLLF
jgi:hypothetical protein